MKAKFKYWCYNNFGTESASVEVVIIAFGEDQALESVKKMVKRDVYKLVTIEIID